MRQRFTTQYPKFVLEYEQGKDAYHAEASVQDNPYHQVFDTEDYLNWNRGWLDAKMEDRDDDGYGEELE